MNRRHVIPLLALVTALPFLAFAPSAVAAAKEAAGKPAKPARVAQGEPIKLTDYLVAGKTTVFDFHSDYCGPCVQMSPMLEKLHQGRDDIIVVKVDINRPGTKGIDWRSPVAQQFGLNSIPHFKVYGPDGKLMAEDKGRDQKARELVMGWIQKLPAGFIAPGTR